MLYFPSKNTAAHAPAPSEVARLSQLLDDDVWAFSNCRVDAPGLPVAEVDWLFYNAARGTFIVCEWKGYASSVATVSDTGAPWMLKNEASVPNPLEQVARQLDAVRRVLRGSIRDTFFPAVDPQSLNAFQCVYSPQIGPETVHERLRFGKVFGTLEDLARTVSSRWSPVPLVAPHNGALRLAEMLGGLFRCSVSLDVSKKLQPVRPGVAVNVTQRMSEIHRELAALHLELARLLQVPPSELRAPDPVPPHPAVAPEKPRKPAGVVAKIPAAPVRATSHERMKRHVDRFLPNPGPKPGAMTKALTSAWLAALTDEELHQDEGISASLFGSLARPHIGEGIAFRELLGTGLSAWCLAQAHAAGLKAEAHPHMPGNITLSGR